MTARTARELAALSDEALWEEAYRHGLIEITGRATTPWQKAGAILDWMQGRMFYVTTHRDRDIHVIIRSAGMHPVSVVGDDEPRVTAIAALLALQEKADA